MQRFVALACDAAGAVLFIAGACGMAWLLHPFLAAFTGGFLLLVAGFLLSPGRGGRSQP